MSMVLGEGAEEITGSKVGLTKGQKFGLFSKATPSPKTAHPYVVGMALIIIGGFGLVGSVTGTLPAMIAGLFVPNALVDSSGSSPNVWGTIAQAVGEAAIVAAPAGA